MNIVVLGPQGSGKSTQAKLLADYLGLPLLGVGELLRGQARGGKHAVEISQALKEGKLIRDLVLTQILKEELYDKRYAQGVVLDGAPRTLAQAKYMESIVDIDKVVYLSVPDSVAQKRLVKRGRFDDTRQLVLRRLQLYHTRTEPVLSYYEEKGILEKIDGERPIESVFADIRARVADDQAKNSERSPDNS